MSRIRACQCWLHRACGAIHCHPAQVGQQPRDIMPETDMSRCWMGYPLSRGALLSIDENLEIVPLTFHEVRLNGRAMAGGTSRYDVDIDGQGRRISSVRRAEAIDSKLRDRDATGALAGRRVREGVFGEQPQGGMLDVSIGWPMSGGQIPGQARRRASKDLQKAEIVRKNC
jgi:hypothetical protein